MAPAPSRPSPEPDEAMIWRLAGEQVFNRGQRYLAGRRVSPLARTDDRVRATVIGSQHHRVELRLGREFAWTCDCPAGQDGLFCRHCVAVALVLARRDRDAGAAGETAAYLRGLDREALVALVLEEAERDEGLRERLRLRAAVAGSDGQAMQRALEA